MDMGLEESGPPEGRVKKCPVDTFLARGRVPRRKAQVGMAQPLGGCLIFYGMDTGLEESGPPKGRVKKCPVDTFLARGRVPFAPERTP